MAPIHATNCLNGDIIKWRQPDSEKRGTNFYQVIIHVQLMIDSVEKLLQWEEYNK
jgi:hypothetical protein